MAESVSETAATKSSKNVADLLQIGLDLLRRDITELGQAILGLLQVRPRGRHLVALRAGPSIEAAPSLSSSTLSQKAVISPSSSSPQLAEPGQDEGQKRRWRGWIA